MNEIVFISKHFSKRRANRLVAYYNVGRDPGPFFLDQETSRFGHHEIKFVRADHE